MCVVASIDRQDVGADSKVRLEELCRMTVSKCIEAGTTDETSLSQAQQLTQAADTTWRKQELAR